MEVDHSFSNQLGSCPRDLVKPGSDHGSCQPRARSSALRVSTKSKAPSPPGLKKLDSPGLSQWSPGSPRVTMDQKENLTEKDLSLVVVLPDGEEKMTVVHGSKPLMDLLVALCGEYHLNPSSHTLELVTANRNSVKLKPNALIGNLEAEKVILKPKGGDKNKKTGPQMPEATVRMVINYKKTQKTILRVNPRVPLAELLPAICEKCEFDLETTVLLKDVESLAPLDLSKALLDYEIREIYAKDTKGQRAPPVCPASPTHAGTVMPGKDKNQKEKENKGLFSMFRKSKKKANEATASSAPASPVLVNKPRPLSMALPSANSPTLDSPTASDVPKKRRAPQPPIQVSQGCASDASARRRLYSEPGSPSDSDQMPRLSRGSSAESSLRRTKRKAPPPPTSPSVTVPETVAVEEHFQGGASDNTLEEIMEQEETTPSLMSATASDAQGEDSSVSMSADVSLHSPSPDTEILSLESVEGSGEDQSRDLSSDGNELQSPVDSSAALGDVKATAGTDSSDPADTNTGACQGKIQRQQSICEESAAESATGDHSPVPSSHLKPVMQDANAQASVEVNTETPWDHADRLESPVVTGRPRLAGEDAQVQTDLPPAKPPQQRTDSVSSAANAAAFASAGKKDMATLTDELHSPDLNLHTSKASSFQDSTQSASLTAKPPSLHADSEPRPKPSNELTRNYIPKVGMTTYTIVPQKSLEKLRYFEVALTLEAPPAAPEEGLNIDSLQIKERSAQTEVSKEHTTPREDVPTRTAANQDAVDGTIPESSPCSLPPSSPTEDGEKVEKTSQAGSPSEVKEIKIPPATKPKPGSFRLAQHKKIPGHYVTSAAEKSLSAGPGSSLREAQGTAEREKLPPPPPPPPVQCQEQTTGVANMQTSPRGDDKSAAMARLTRQSSLPCKEPSTGLSLEKLRSFAAPRPFSPSTPSRFAQAVSSAVKRSHSLSHGPRPPRSPVSPPISPIPRQPSAIEPKGLFFIKDSDNSEVGSDTGSTLQEVEGKPQCFRVMAPVEQESSP